MALLRLDAADRQHRLARDVDHVAAERKGKSGLLGKAEPARADQDDGFVDALLSERSVHTRDGELEGKRHMIREDEWRRTRTTLTTVDRDEIRSAPRRRHE